MQIWGGDYDTPDGTALRDYFSVRDLARAHVLGAEALADGTLPASYWVVNVGAGRPVSVLEFVKAFEKASGLRIPYQICARRAGDLERSYASVARALSMLGWRPEESLVEALRSAWAWEGRE